jgi:putative ABC transport system permease protein
MFIRKLTFANVSVRRMRAALTVAAVALSVSLVVAVTSGYASALASAHQFLTRYLGSVDVTVIQHANVHGGVSEKIIDAMRGDPRVRQAIGRVEMQNASLKPSKDPNDPGKLTTISGIVMPGDFLVQSLVVARGKWFTGDDGNFVVIDQGTATAMSLEPGDPLTVPGLDKKMTLTVVGVVHKPSIMTQSRQMLYVPLKTLQRFTDFQGRVSRILVQLEPGVDAEQFAAEWSSRVKEIEPGAQVRSAQQAKEQMDRELESVHVLSYMGGIVSMLAATFIIFSALSMGVSERQRTLAMLRAVGASKWQVAALVVLEGMLLAAAGAVIGVALGWAWMEILAWKFRPFFVAGVVMSGGGIALGVIGSLIAALAVSLLPAWSAARVSPLEAMSPLASPPASRVPWWSALAGAALIMIDPILLFGPIQHFIALFGASKPAQTAGIIRFYGHFALGLPSVMLGFFLLSPLAVVIVEAVAAPIIAPLFGVRAAMLRQQLTGGVWRVAGTCTALMVGLATLIVLQVQGHTALGGWKLPDKFPDIFIASYSMAGVQPDDVKKLSAIPGIKPGQVMPIAIALPGLSTGFFGLAQAMVMPDATMFFGVDPDVGIRMMDLDFREGSADTAIPMLKAGRHVLITNEFRQLKNLHVGGKLTLQTLHGPVDYTVAGVIWSPGLDVISSYFDLGMEMDQRTAASVFGTLDDARRDFGIDRYRLVGANLDYFVDRDEILKRVQKALNAQGLIAGDVREIKYQIESWFYKILMLVSSVAFAAMAVASLGVTNTIMASVRSRRWQFGVLRSIGVTRGTLLRLVLAEAALLGLVACALGLAAGALMSVDAHALAVLMTGYNPPLVTPWNVVGWGMLIVMAISLAASAAPAAAVALAEPLTLLQAGRSAS